MGPGSAPSQSFVLDAWWESFRCQLNHIGLRAERMIALVDLWIAYGAMRQIHRVFLAEGLIHGSHKGRGSASLEWSSTKSIWSAAIIAGKT
jgi:hypothetical protein